ncbi:MAG: hypothetical protein VB093_09360 [Propionicimonas sp.]|nr:hypothetical protein [Propionicimonas sp.]
MSTGAPHQAGKPAAAAGRWWAVGVLVAAAGAAVLVLTRRYPRRALVAVRPPPAMPTGLSAAEAEARYLRGEAKAAPRSIIRSARSIGRESVFTVFHLNLVGLALVQVLLLNEWFAAVMTVVMLGVSIGIRTVQEKLAGRSLTQLLQTTRLRYTAVRDERPCSVPPERVVPGDLLLVGPGDQFLGDGVYRGTRPVLIDSSAADGVRGTRQLRPGGRVLAGSYCVSGRGSYVIQTLGPDTFMAQSAPSRQRNRGRMSPLEAAVSRILQVLLGVVVVYAGLYLAELNRLDIGEPLEAFVDAAPVIFNLAPSGLYLMIIVSYIVGAASLARHGGAVTRARAIETLAETTVVCFTEVGMLAGTSVDLTVVRHSEGEHPSEPRIRQLLGDAVRSTSSTTALMRALSEAFEGERRPISAEVPYLTSLGWVGLAFADGDDGVYVLGRREALQAALTGELPARRPGEEELVVAYRPDRVPLRDEQGRPQLPDLLVPLAILHLAATVRDGAMAAIQGFVARGVQVKAFAAGSAAASLNRLVDQGLSAADADHVRTRGLLSRDELMQHPQSEWARVVRSRALFGGFSPVEVGQIVASLREAGEHVTVVGDGVTDLPAMIEADLAVAQPGSAQAAVALADIHLQTNSPQALLAMLQRGQSIVHGLLNVIKLDLTMVVAAATLIILVRLLSWGFPYISAHGSALGILAGTIPSLALTAWSGTGPAPSEGYRRAILRFILPVGISLALVGFVVYHHFFATTGRMAYAQQAVAYVLIYAALLVAVMTLRSPRMILLAAGLMVVATVQAGVPLTRWLWRLGWLEDPADYATVALAVLGWFAAVLLVRTVVGIAAGRPAAGLRH